MNHNVWQTLASLGRAGLPAAPDLEDRHVFKSKRKLTNGLKVWTVEVSHLARSWFGLFLACYLGLTLPLAWKLNLWIDEASTLQTTSRGLRNAVGMALSYELQAPLYFVLLAGWRMLSNTVFHARLFSVLCIVGMLVVLVGVARRYLPTIHPKWVVLAIAFNPFTIWAATEARVYALVLLLGALLFWLFFEGYVAESPRRSVRWEYGLVALLALYTYYYLGFLLFAHGCSLLLLRRWRTAGAFLGAMLMVGIGFAPLLAQIPGQMTGYTGAVTQQQSFKAGVQMLSWRLQEQLLPVGWPSLEVGRRGVLIVFGLLALVFVVRRIRQTATPAHYVIWTTGVITSVCLLAAYLLTSAEFLEARHSTVLFLPAILSVFAIFTLFTHRGAIVGGVLVLCFFSLTSLMATYAYPAKTGDWERVASHLMAAEQREQPILIFQAISAAPLSHYYAGVNRLLPIPQAEQFQAFNHPDSVLKSEAQLHAILAQIPGKQECLWLVTDELCRSVNLDLNCRVLESFVEKYYDVEVTQNFYRSKVRLLRRKPPTLH
ncbi:MAG: hypothetical protein JNM09_00830 [Blastocatellia bacterium]|nr:hypothetical protein [Blastocatellia bacterium]